MKISLVINEVIATYDGVDTSDGNTTKRKADLFTFFKHVYKFVHNYRPWEWTWEEKAFTVAASAFSSADIETALPGHLEFGRKGYVYDVDRRLVLKEKDAGLVSMLRQSNAAARMLRYFAISGHKIQLPYVCSSLSNFIAYHRILDPVMEAAVDATDATTLLMPDKYKDTVIIPALTYRLQNSKDDAREDWGAMFRQGLAQMCELERPQKTATQKAPLAYRGVW